MTVSDKNYWFILYEYRSLGGHSAWEKRGGHNAWEKIHEMIAVSPWVWLVEHREKYPHEDKRVLWAEPISQSDYDKYKDDLG